MAHVFDHPLENGRELENEEVVVVTKDTKKEAKKETKKGPKDKFVEEVKETEHKMEMNWDALANKKKRKHLNGLWFVKFKLSIVNIYYQ